MHGRRTQFPDGQSFLHRFSLLKVLGEIRNVKTMQQNATCASDRIQVLISCRTCRKPLKEKWSQAEPFDHTTKVLPLRREPSLDVDCGGFAAGMFIWPRLQLLFLMTRGQYLNVPSSAMIAAFCTTNHFIIPVLSKRYSSLPRPREESELNKRK